MLCPSVATLAFYGKLVVTRIGGWVLPKFLTFAALSLHIIKAYHLSAASAIEFSTLAIQYAFNRRGEYTTNLSCCRNTFPIHWAHSNILAVEHRQESRRRGCMHGMVVKSTNPLCVGIDWNRHRRVYIPTEAGSSTIVHDAAGLLGRRSPGLSVIPVSPTFIRGPTSMMSDTLSSGARLLRVSHPSSPLVLLMVFAPVSSPTFFEK